MSAFFESEKYKHVLYKMSANEFVLIFLEAASILLLLPMQVHIDKKYK